FQAEDGIRDFHVTGVQTCALPICGGIVAIKDTLLTQEGWPWLQAWNDMPIGTELKQDEDNLMILEMEFSEEDLQNALAYAVDERSEERRVGKECRFRWEMDR